MKKLAEELKIPFLLHDIDTDAVKADELVEKYGDWSEDYLIPQVFIEFEDGTFDHVLTGDSKGTKYTAKLVDDFIKSPFIINQKNRKPQQ